MQDDEATDARSISSVNTIEAIERSIAAMDTVSSGYYVRQPRTTVDRAVQTDGIFIEIPAIIPAPIGPDPIIPAALTAEQLREAND